MKKKKLLKNKKITKASKKLSKKNLSSQSTEGQNYNLKNTKSSDQKPEIVKIKKQATEKGQKIILIAQ